MAISRSGGGFGPPATAAGVFPLLADGGGRHLVQANGSTPFPLLVRTLWSINGLNATDYQALIDNTASHGFTALELALNHFPASPNHPFTSGGDAPFSLRLDAGTWSGATTYGNPATDAPDFSTPKEAFWAVIDGIMDYAKSKKLAVVFFCAYAGFSDAANDGWLEELRVNSKAKMTTFGAFLGNRYASRANIIWGLGGDRGIDGFTQAEIDAYQGMIDGLESSNYPKPILYTNEWGWPGGIGTTQADFGSVVAVNGCYAFTGLTATYCRDGFADTPTIPAYLQEGPFDEEGPGDLGRNDAATQPIRRYSWRAILSAIAGYTFGNGYVWSTQSGYASHFNTTQTVHHSYLHSFWKSIAWQRLIPNGLGGIGTLITAGGGTIDTNDHVAAAATSLGDLLVAYLGPSSGNPTIDMTKMRGTVTARWFDPTNGSYQDVAGQPFANTGTRTFTDPGNNSAGDGDWVLRLDA
jgi:hypothetical protein